MNFKKALGFGLALWVAMFVIVSVFVAFDIYKFGWMKIVTIFIGGFISWFLAGYAKPRGTGSALGYGVSFAIVALVLDAVITTRFDATIFRDWSLWVGYLLVVFAPLLRIEREDT